MNGNLTSVGPRSSWAVMRSVIYALFLREAVTRLSLGRGGWVWIIVEQAEHLVLLIIWHGIVQHHLIPGMNAPLFIGLGLLPYFMMKSIALRGIDAIPANRALFVYRQIKPLDAVIARAILEGLIFLSVGVVLIVAFALFGVDVSIGNPLLVAGVFALFWLFGLGLGLALSVLTEMVHEIGTVTRMVFGIIYFGSSVLYPTSWIPAAWQHVYFFNPIVHAVELMRAGYFAHYRPSDLVSPAYLMAWVFGWILAGLFLHVRFAKRLVER
ncbi:MULTISPECIES: ABC transporter permease [unclassified Caballeronia]|uniref:ABC transporter permease n=1 Tax=unclassified Caballeronia TaxID=2646786 RepID=UPI0016565714|nr:MULTISPECIES: ABC transporter permease [unclassified Caballeronia]MBC8641321.1 ABC transporter permease [Caballeronia sp. EK]